MAETKEKSTARDLQARQTKCQLFDAAIRLIREIGYDHVKITDITRAVGVSKGTFYLYFPTKDAVLAEQFAALDEHYVQSTKQLPDAAVEEQLLFFLTQMCEYISNVCGLNIMKTLYMNQISTELCTKLLSNSARPFYKIMTEFVHRGTLSGFFRTDLEETEVRNLLIRAVHGLIYDWCLYDASFSLVEEGKRYFAHTLEMLQARS